MSCVEDFDVVCDNIGRRPWRQGGLRIEVEDYEFCLDDGYYAGQTGQVVHGYGAGGRGYELSWGAAEQIRSLIVRQIRAESFSSRL